MLSIHKLNDSQKIWILSGYQLFALEGPQGLKIEVMARQVEKSKSSFYHHFADISLFTEFLLEYHLHRNKVIAEREKLCKSIDPELIDILLEVKQDLLFNRQLRIHRQETLFQVYLEKSNQETEAAFLPLLAQEIGLEKNQALARMVLNLALENFYLQITPETLNREWLQNYFQNIQQMVRKFELNNLSGPS